MKKAILMIVLLGIISVLLAGCHATQKSNILYDDPLSEEIKQNISYALLMQCDVKMTWNESDLYYGTINNCIVFRFGPEACLDVLSHTEIAGYRFNWFYTPLRFYAYRDGEVCELSEAYEQGWLTKEQIGKIHEKHELFCGKS